MAEVLSGSFETTHRQYTQYPNRAYFNWTGTQSTSGNYTDISWTFTLGGSTSSTASIQIYSGSVTVNGETHSFNYSSEGYKKNGFELKSGTTRVYHNDDGSKNFSASGGVNIFGSNEYYSGGTSWDLKRIPRQATATSASNFDDEHNPTLGYENKAGNSVNSLQACIADTSNNAIVAYRDINKTGSSYTFPLTASERTALRNSVTTANSKTVRLFVKTVIGNNTYHSYKECTMSIVNANPTFSNFTYQDTNSTITAVTGNNQVLVRGKSTLKVTISSANKAVPNKSASMSSYLASISGLTASANYSTSDINMTFSGNSFTAGSQTLSVKATDSRNNATTVNKTVTVLNYASPVISPSLKRLNNFENSTTVSVSGSFSTLAISGTNKNTINSVEYRYKESTSSTWGSWTTMTKSVNTNGTYTGTLGAALDLNNSKQFNFEFRVADKLETKTLAYTLSEGQPQFFVGDDGRVAVGGTPAYSKGSSDSGLLDVKGKIYASTNIYAGQDLYTTRNIYRNNVDIARLSPATVQIYSTAIPANANLNTTTYLKVGNYYCSNSSTAGSLSNCPTGNAFAMEVSSPLNNTIDDETTAAWKYRVRKITTYAGEVFIQNVDSGSTAGSFTYRPWYRVERCDNRAQKGVWSSFYYAGTNANDQDLTVYTKKGTALTLRMSNGGGILLVKGGGGNIKFARQTWSTKYTSMNQNYGVQGLASGTHIYTRYIGAVVNNDVPNCGEWDATVDGGDTSNGYYGNLASTTGGNRNATTCSMTMTRVGGSGTAWALQGTISSNGIRCAMSFDAQVTALNNNFIPTTYQRGENKSNTSAYSQLLEVFEG